MPEQWNNYFCNVNDKLASIALDLSLAATAPISKKPLLLWVWLYMLHPREDGLSSTSEFEALSAIEEGLTEALGHACGAINVGRITTDRHREFYFYGADDSRFEVAVNGVMSRFENYEFEVGSKADPNWEQYFSVLYPSKEDFQKIKNGNVLDVLIKHGDTLTPERKVDHWIYFRRANDRTRLAANVERLGYKIVSRSELDKGERRFCLQICRSQSVTPDAIDDAVRELFCLAEALDGEYDGWETEIVSTKH